jgi:hypothetical protein
MMSGISASLWRASLGLKHISQTFILSMPRSIDLSSYGRTGVGEEAQFLPIARSSHDSDSDNATLLEKAEGPIMKTPRNHFIRSPWLFLLDVLLLVMVMVYYAATPISLHLSFLGDVTGYVPNFSQQIVVFGSHPEFISNHTSLASLQEAREHWIKLLPRKQSDCAQLNLLTKPCSRARIYQSER